MAQSPRHPLHSSPFQHNPQTPKLRLLSPFLFTSEQMPPATPSLSSSFLTYSLANLSLIPIPTTRQNSFSTNHEHQLFSPTSGPPHPIIRFPTEGKDDVLDKRTGSTPSSVTNCFMWSWKRHVISLDLSLGVGFIDNLRALLIWKSHYWFFPLASMTWHYLDSLNNSLSPLLGCVVHLLNGDLFLQSPSRMHFKWPLSHIYNLSMGNSTHTDTLNLHF